MKAPTFDEVQQYCLERRNKVDPGRFTDYYESVGWCVGRKKMKDWKAAVRTWERNDKDWGAAKPQPKAAPIMERISDRSWAL